MARRRRRKKSAAGWLWEYSKRVVTVMAVLYFISFIYAMAVCFKAMCLEADTTALSTLITEVNETFRVVIGGYLIKAGVENATKIVTAKRQTQDEDGLEFIDLNDT